MPLLGHSHGGAVGTYAIDGTCVFPFCEGGYSRPDKLVAGAFFGTNVRDPVTGEFSPVNNSGIPIALLQGSRDSRATPERTQGTYDQIQDPPKALIAIVGANHFGITNTNNPS